MVVFSGHIDFYFFACINVVVAHVEVVRARRFSNIDMTESLFGTKKSGQNY